MKKILVMTLASIFAFASFSFAEGHGAKKDEMMKMKKEKMDKLDKKVKSERPNNIDKHNVGITKHEGLDQSDPSIIEGNLEDNDFKN